MGVEGERSNDPSTLVDLCRAANPVARVNVCASLAEGIASARNDRDGVVVITGSLFLVGEALALLTGKSDSELRLQ